MLHASSDQSGAHVSIKLGHLDLIQIAVDPVEFSGDPVHGQALRGGQTVLHHHFDPRHPWNNNPINREGGEYQSTHSSGAEEKVKDRPEESPLFFPPQSSHY